MGFRCGIVSNTWYSSIDTLAHCILQAIEDHAQLYFSHTFTHRYTRSFETFPLVALLFSVIFNSIFPPFEARHRNEHKATTGLIFKAFGVN